MAFPSFWYENPETMDKSSIESTNKSAKIIACTLCGDMVKDDWSECPHCGEAIS
jgi:hypothetical protein